MPTTQRHTVPPRASRQTIQVDPQPITLDTDELEEAGIPDELPERITGGLQRAQAPKTRGGGCGYLVGAAIVIGCILIYTTYVAPFIQNTSDRWDTGTARITETDINGASWIAADYRGHMLLIEVDKDTHYTIYRGPSIPTGRVITLDTQQVNGAQVIVVHVEGIQAALGLYPQKQGGIHGSQRARHHNHRRRLRVPSRGRTW